MCKFKAKLYGSSLNKKDLVYILNVLTFAHTLPNSCKTLTFDKTYRPWELIYEPVHEISNNVVCATSKVSDQPAHTRSLTRAFASRLSIL